MAKILGIRELGYQGLCKKRQILSAKIHMTSQQYALRAPVVIRSWRSRNSPEIATT